MSVWDKIPFSLHLLHLPFLLLLWFIHVLPPLFLVASVWSPATSYTHSSPLANKPIAYLQSINSVPLAIECASLDTFRVQRQSLTSFFGSTHSGWSRRRNQASKKTGYVEYESSKKTGYVEYTPRIVAAPGSAVQPSIPSSITRGRCVARPFCCFYSHKAACSLTRLLS